MCCVLKALIFKKENQQTLVLCNLLCRLCLLFHAVQQLSMEYQFLMPSPVVISHGAAFGYCAYRRLPCG